MYTIYHLSDCDKSRFIMKDLAPNKNVSLYFERKKKRKRYSRWEKVTWVLKFRKKIKINFEIEK